ncbi:MAG: AAA family ATPase [Planctomycetaceae bacterium]|jgi:predicted ATP-binding protein involved in virulence|nr:AAA family ATPase [Planctomycetaceae bacterium]
MYIKSLSIENFRGIRKMLLPLNPRLNVFVGINGSGKSSVLDAMKYLLTPYVAGLCDRDCSVSDQVNDFPFEEIYYNENESKLSFTSVKNGKETSGITLRSQRRSTANDRGESAISHIYRNREWIKFFVDDDLLLPEDRIDISWQRFIEKRQQINTCILVYFPVNRMIDDVPIDAWSNRNFRPEDAFVDAMSTKTNFKEFFEWYAEAVLKSVKLNTAAQQREAVVQGRSLPPIPASVYRNREDLENEERKEDRQLSTVRNAISVFLGDVKPPKIYRRDPLRMVVVKNGIELRIQQRSDGEKCLLVMIGDLARRLAIANPLRENPLEGEGVILIDEIDLHLHPTWQHTIIPQLTKTFPNCQFLISTHSPHVITHVHPNNLFALQMKNNEITFEQPRESYGKNAEQILRDIMKLSNSRPDCVAENLNKIYQLIDDKKLDEAKNAIANLQDEISNDTELFRASALVKRKELIGK